MGYILNGIELTFDQETHFKEINLRGMCMTMSADMESILLKIVLYCIVDDPTPVIRTFEGMTMGSKLQMAKLDLKKYYPKQYEKYKESFKEMEKFNKLRIKMAHYDFSWDETKKSTKFIYIHDLQKIKGEYRFTKSKNSIEDIETKMNKFRKNILKMATVLDYLSTDFNHKYPNFFNSSHT